MFSWVFFTETFALYLCNFNIVENVTVVKSAFWKKMSYMLPNHISGKHLGYSLLVKNDL